MAQNTAPITPQAQRGRELFLRSPKGIACATCHEVAGAGTAIGPNLTRLAAVLGPREMALLMVARIKEHVQLVTVSGQTFAGIQKQRQGEEIEIWDLSRTPPELRKLSAIESIKPDPGWEHPPREAGYTLNELADVIAYLEWTATGSQKKVKPDEVDVRAVSRSR